MKQTTHDYRDSLWRKVTVPAVALLAFIASQHAQADTSDPSAKIVQITASNGWFSIKLDDAVSIANPHSTCTAWTGNYEGYIQPISDTAKAKLAVAVEAFALGKEVKIVASSCTYPSNYPIIDTVLMFE